MCTKRNRDQKDKDFREKSQDAIYTFRLGIIMSKIQRQARW